MFTVSDRDGLLADLTQAALDDKQVIAAAALGSTATQATDAWSDIDLALRVAPDAEYDVGVELRLSTPTNLRRVSHTRRDSPS